MITEYKTSEADMIVGIRIVSFEEGSFRHFHKFGNHLIARLISRLFFNEGDRHSFRL